MIIPPLYFVSLLHSLVARVTIRKMLDSHLANEGMHRSAVRGVVVSKSTIVHSYPSNEVIHLYEDGVGELQSKDVGGDDGDAIVPLQSISMSASGR